VLSNETIIFLSYTREDAAKVRVLYKKLKTLGFSPWMDIEDLLPGENWRLVVKTMIEKAQFFIACLSQNAASHRGIVQTEFKEALEVAKQKLETDIHFIPARLDDCQVPQRMRKYNWVNLFEDDGFEKLVDAIKEGMKRLGIFHLLRSQPIDRLSEDDVREIIKKRGFFDAASNDQCKGLKHYYGSIQRQGTNLIVDYTTGLTWQRSGATNSMNFSSAVVYIQ